MIKELYYEGDLCPLNQKYCNRKFTLSKRYREAKEEFTLQTKVKYKGSVNKHDTFRIGIFSFYTHSHDVDAFIKFILDAMQGIVYKSDSQVIELFVRKNIIDKNETPKAKVYIEKI